MDKIKVAGSTALNFIKNHKLVLALALVGVGLAYFFFNRRGGQDHNMENSIMASETSIVEHGVFEEIITENGKVVSENSTTVYPEMEGRITEVNVEVGDQVKEGDVLGKIDDSELRKKIKETEVSMSENSKSKALQVESAQANLNRALRNLNNGTNPEIVAAQAAINQAYDTWQEAQKAYDYAVASTDQKSLEAGIKESVNIKDAHKQTQRAVADFATKESESSKKINELYDNIYSKRQDRVYHMDIVQRNGRTYNSHVDLLNAKSDLDIEQRKLASTQRELAIEQAKLGQSQPVVQNQPSQPSQPGQATGAQNPEQGGAGQTGTNQAPKANHPDQYSPPVFDNSNKINDLEGQIRNIQDVISRLEGAIASMEAIETIDNEITTMETEISTTNSNLSREKANINEEADKTMRESLMAEERLKSTQMAREEELRNLQTQIENAEKSYLKALDDLDMSKISANDQVNDLKRSLKEASSSTTALDSINLQNMKDQLANSIIKAPFDGTITDVNMTQGEKPQGFVAKIETIDRTLVHSSVKEYDVNTIVQGMDVEITANSLGTDKVFKGQVELVYPTPGAGGSVSEKNSSSSGGSQSGGISYKSIISFDDDVDISEIQPGMNVRVRYIIQKQEDVITVPTSSIVTMGDKSYLFVLNDRTSQVEEVEVSIHGENEFQSVIRSKDLKDGMRYLNNPQMYAPGQKLDLIDEQTIDSQDGMKPMEIEVEEEEDLGFSFKLRLA